MQPAHERQSDPERKRNHDIVSARYGTGTAKRFSWIRREPATERFHSNWLPAVGVIKFTPQRAVCKRIINHPRVPAAPWIRSRAREVFRTRTSLSASHGAGSVLAGLERMAPIQPHSHGGAAII